MRFGSWLAVIAVLCGTVGAYVMMGGYASIISVSSWAEDSTPTNYTCNKIILVSTQYNSSNGAVYALFPNGEIKEVYRGKLVASMAVSNNTIYALQLSRGEMYLSAFKYNKSTGLEQLWEKKVPSDIYPLNWLWFSSLHIYQNRIVVNPGDPGVIIYDVQNDSFSFIDVWIEVNNSTYSVRSVYSSVRVSVLYYQTMRGYGDRIYIETNAVSTTTYLQAFIVYNLTLDRMTDIYLNEKSRGTLVYADDENVYFSSGYIFNIKDENFIYKYNLSLRGILNVSGTLYGFGLNIKLTENIGEYIEDIYLININKNIRSYICTFNNITIATRLKYGVIGEMDGYLYGIVQGKVMRVNIKNPQDFSFMDLPNPPITLCEYSLE